MRSSIELPPRIRLAQRAFHSELMDRPDIDRLSHESALRGLARVNWISRSYQTFWTHIAQLSRTDAGRPVRVLDVACGGGDVAVKLARAARRSGLNVTVDGCDVSGTALAFATERATRSDVNCRFFKCDVLNDSLPQDYDVICSSLFLHHLETNAAEKMLRQFSRAAQRLVLVNDLVRSRLGYLLAWVGTRLLSRSPVVHYDGPISVANAFTPIELQDMAHKAGMTGARIRKVWPERMLLAWNKS